jgi:DNA-binding response OmpR family regulator
MSSIPPILKAVILEHMPNAQLAGVQLNLPDKLSNILAQLKAPAITKIGSHNFNPAAKTIDDINLTEKETEIIQHLLLVQKATKEELLEKIWGYSSAASTNTVETHIYRLKQKLDIIISEAGFYKLSK